MAGKRKRKSQQQRIHPRNKYSDNPPDFGLLASLYSSFKQYVFYSHDGRPKIDWTDFNATRELTRVLLLHDHGLNWWIPDGQLCPTVPNRSNYIHWIEDLLASDVVPCTQADGNVVKGFDIGTGANCIYPLLGASLLGWKFVGSDVTEVAIEWANQNVRSNPQISEMIEIRRVDCKDYVLDTQELQNSQQCNSEAIVGSSNNKEIDNGPSSVLHLVASVKKSYDGPPILLGVVKDGENFDFCMCNPPFFDTMDEAGLNPKTSCGGTPDEMVCSGGEYAFITRIIEDSVKLKTTFRWYTSMVGRKLNLNSLVSCLWNVGATVVKTTEFVQGKTSRWGLAWSFLPTSKKIILSQVTQKKNLSFMLEGLQRQYSAFHVLQSVESFFINGGTACKLNSAAFNIDITASKDHLNAILMLGPKSKSEDACCELETVNSSNNYDYQSDVWCFSISVFQQIPGTLLVKGTMKESESSISGLFLLVFQQLEEYLKKNFCNVRVLSGGSSSKHRR